MLDIPKTRLGREKLLPDDGERLLDDLSAFIRRFMIITQAQADAMAIWCVHTHAVEAAEFTPYLHIFSPVFRSGKTKLLQILSLVVAKPWFTGRVTPAVLVRKTHKEQTTLLLDETDAAFSVAKSSYAETLRGVLNTGFERDGRYSVCVKAGSDYDTRDFSTFSPKAIAGIGRLPDTVEDRSIPIKLKRKLLTEACEPFKKKFVKPDAKELKSRTDRWTKQNLDILRNAAPAVPEELNDRQQDVCDPLLAIADLAGRSWQLRARKALVELCTGHSLRNESIGSTLLSDIRACFEFKNADRLPTKSLLHYLNSLEESPWAEFKSGRKLTPQGLAKLLKPFDIKPRDIRCENAIKKGYLRTGFWEAWNRYLPADAVRKC